MDPIVQIFARPLARLSMWYRPILYSLISMISINVLTHSDLDRISDSIGMTIGDNQDTFDFIIVGGGSSGAVVANRLSEDFNVLLLEAGGDPSPLGAIPALALLMLRQPNIDWRYTTSPQSQACLAMNNHECYWPRGRGLGGSSNLNFMIYLRGHAKDYNNWAHITGDTRWNYENVVTFFKKSENYQYDGVWDSERRRLHSTGGALNVQKPDYTGLADTFVQAGKEFGYPEADLNGNFTEGFETNFFSQKNGRRCGTYKAFLEPILTRKGLTIYKYAHVNRLMLGPENQVVGVEYERHGSKRYAFVTKEVILSAGAINTPKILMLSGIGPKDHLDSLGIPVRANLPVGQNLQDHITTFVGPFTVNDSVTFNLDRDLTPQAFYQFATYGTGPLTSTGPVASAFVTSSYAKATGESDWPDLQYMLLGTAVYDNAPQNFEFAFNVRDGILHKYYSKIKNLDSFMVITILGRPKTRGEITLAGTNPTLPPRMNPKYYQDTEGHDMRVMVEGIQRSVRLIENSTAFQSMDAKLTPTLFPGCESYIPRSDAYFECYARHLSLTMYHPSSTCPMGRANDPKAVVDSELRVLGVKGLRIVDASVMPTIVSSNPNAACIMIGEMGADLVISTWSKYNDIKK